MRDRRHNAPAWRGSTRLALIVTLGLGAHGAAHAQSATSYPTRPVTVIVPFAAGGPADLESRLYTPKLTELLGQSIVIDYKPGGGTAVGTQQVIRSKPDGYTLLAATAALTVFPAFQRELGFDVVKDLQPISLMSKRSSVMMVRPGFPAATFTEYVSYARSNPGKINYGTAGVGEVSHLAGLWLHALTKTTATFVPFKGTGPVLIELMAGRVDVTSGTLVAALPVIRSGKARALVMLSDQRSKQLPDVPTVAEQGYPEYNYSNWLGFLAPPGTPAAIVTRLNEAMAKVARLPEIVTALDGQGSIAVGGSPSEFGQLVAAEVMRWRKIVDDAELKAN